MRCDVQALGSLAARSASIRPCMQRSTHTYIPPIDTASVTHTYIYIRTVRAWSPRYNIRYVRNVSHHSYLGGRIATVWAALMLQFSALIISRL